MKAARICLAPRRPSLLKQCKTISSQYLRFASQIAHDGDAASALTKSTEDAVNRVSASPQAQIGTIPRRVQARPSPPIRYSYNPLAEGRPVVSSPQEPTSNARRKPSTEQEHTFQEKFIERPTLERFPDAEVAHRTGFLSTEQDFTTVKEALPILVGDGPWQISKAKPRRLYRIFRFKTFKTTWEFMNIIAAECAIQKHHPEWANIYNRVRINWITHNPPGLSAKDIYMAKFCDEKAAELGELPFVLDYYPVMRLGSLTENEMKERTRVMDHLKKVLRSGKQMDQNHVKSLVARLVKLG